MSLSPGATLGPYAIRAELGHGGMGVVYTAHDPRLKRQVAIKLLTADLTRDETAKQRFLQEAQAASALDHPNICTIYEINETTDGQLYLVMAYYAGETLKQRIERGPLALDEAVDIATQVGLGLAEAHGAGIVHRDIKPANLLIATSGVVKILDFGLAKLAGTEGVTQTGTTVGTVADLHSELRGVKRALRDGTTAGEQAMPSIAVLPFANMSADPEQEYFCDGLAEELIDALARLDGLRVTARTSAFQFRGKGHDLHEVADKLGVSTILEGSVRKAGNRLRINAQLINASDGFHLWSERYDREMDDIFAVQDAIAHAVVESLKVQLLGDAGASLVRSPADSLEAYNLVLKGHYYVERLTGLALEKGAECFSQALVIEPSNARAHAGLASTRARQASLNFVAPHEVMPGAKEAALKALGIDETVEDAHYALAVVLDYYDWDWAGAEREYRRTLELNASHTVARFFYGDLLTRQGRANSGIAEVREAVEGDPLSLRCRHFLALGLYCAERFDDVIAEAEDGIALDPNAYYFHIARGWGLAGLGRHTEAIESHRRATSLAADDPGAQGYLGLALGVAGEHGEARAMLRDLEQRRTQGYIGGWLLACVYVGLGVHDRAIEWLQTAADERDGLLPWLMVFPPFDPLRADPRFQALLRRMNFPETASTA